jgi:L-alanine-DL-glutamate epimerase-like enolase superfamily enzyme
MTDLETRFERLDLPLADAFTISRGTTEVAANVLVEIDDGDHVGIGATAPSARYDETPGSVEAVLPDLLTVVEAVGDPHALARIERRLRETAPDEAAGRAAVSIALHDLVAKRLGLPLYRSFGLDAGAAPPTSITVGLDAPDRMGEKARSAAEEGFPVLKVKIGSDRPVERVAAVREAAPGATIRVDANEAWEPAVALGIIDDLARLGVEFVEQPVSAGSSAGLDRVGREAALPVAADESCLVAADVPDVARWADVVVVKLAKAGGVREAVRTIHAAHAHGLDAMLGCMVESNASLAAACCLAPMVEHADLDGSLLLAEDPFAGVPMPEGRIKLGAVDRSGTGAHRE